MIDCVIFDFDGTIVASNEIKKNTFYEVTKHLSGSSQELDNIFSSPNYGDRYSIMNQLVKNLKIENEEGISAHQLAKSYSDICDHKVSHAKEINGAIKAINELKKLKIKVFISSATPKLALINIISARGWERLFDEIFGSPQSKNEHVQIIISKYQVSNKYTVYVGDSEIDRITASSNGCQFIGVGDNWSRFSTCLLYTSPSPRDS